MSDITIDIPIMYYDNQVFFGCDSILEILEDDCISPVDIKILRDTSESIGVRADEGLLKSIHIINSGDILYFGADSLIAFLDTAEAPVEFIDFLKKWRYDENITYKEKDFVLNDGS